MSAAGRRWWWPAALLAALLAASGSPVGCARRGPQPGPVGDAGLLIAGVTLIDGTGAPPAAAVDVHVEGKRIARVAAAGERGARPGARVVAGRGLYAIPGLWDFHVHLSKSGPSALPVLVANGVTSVRDMGGDLERIDGWRTDVAAGRRIGPRIWTAGPMLESPASVERAIASGSPEDFARTRVVVRSAEGAEAAVAGLRDRGVDFVKLRTVADAQTYFAIAAACRRLRLPLMGHPPWEMDPLEAAAAGQRTFEHGFYPYPLSDHPAGPDALAERLRAAGTAFVPTLVAWRSRTVPLERLRAVVEDDLGRIEPRRRYVSDRLLENWVEYLDERSGEDEEASDLEGWASAIDAMAADLGRLHAGGVPILAGTDLAAPLVYPGFSLHEELVLMVEKIGLEPLEVIRLATAGAAAAMGVADERGTVEPGKAADLVLLDGDPAADVRNVSRIVGVVLGGRYLDRAALGELLSRGAAPG